MNYLKTTLSIGALLIGSGLHSQTYQVGDTVSDFTLTDYITGSSTSLHELGKDGGVLVLEWFAWWCPFCANSAANVETGIVEYYAARDGNPYGVPVKHIALNVQGAARAQSDNFIQTYGFTSVMEDYSRSFFKRFSPSGGQPLFVIINAEETSPNVAQWEVLYTRLNYSSNAAPDISALMRPVIDSVQASIPENPVRTAFPEIPDPVDGWYESAWFGSFYDVGFPFIYHSELGYGYLLDGPDEAIYYWNSDLGWIYTNPDLFPFLYAPATDDWLYLLHDPDGSWLYDYAPDNWFPLN